MSLAEKMLHGCNNLLHAISNNKYNFTACENRRKSSSFARAQASKKLRESERVRTRSHLKERNRQLTMLYYDIIGGKYND